MSIQKLRGIFEALDTSEGWNLQLLRVATSKRTGTSYIGRMIHIDPDKKLNEMVSNIKEKYTKKGGELERFTDCVEYDGSAVNTTVYKMKTSNELIAEDYGCLAKALAETNTELSPFQLKYNAYVLCGTIKLDDSSVPIKLITARNPVTTLHNKYCLFGEKFKEIDKEVLSLVEKVDAVIIDGFIYMISLDVEKIFNMERSYKKICDLKVDEIVQYDIVTDPDIFVEFAKKGFNPRRFVSYNPEYLDKITKDKKSVKSIAKKFDIPVKGGKIDTSEPKNVEKFIKLLCGKGMLNPFDKMAMEVEGSKKWK